MIAIFVNLACYGVQPIATGSCMWCVRQLWNVNIMVPMLAFVFLHLEVHSNSPHPDSPHPGRALPSTRHPRKAKLWSEIWTLTTLALRQELLYICSSGMKCSASEKNSVCLKKEMECDDLPYPSFLHIQLALPMCSKHWSCLVMHLIQYVWKYQYWGKCGFFPDVAVVELRGIWGYW